MKISNPQDQPVQKNDQDSRIRHHNPPILMPVYRDPDTGKKKVIIVAAMVGGATDVEFSLDGNGPSTRTARITYSWPKLAYDFDALFAREIKLGTVPSCHPKILALKKDLEKHRDSPDEAPKGVMMLTLPIRVQTDLSSISRKDKRDSNGTHLLIIELMAFQSA